MALSGGGARGLAHVGVLEVLEELRIPVDYVAGTSMGAIVGGLYASGLSAAEIRQVLETMDWAAMAEDAQPRRDRTYRRKEDDQRYVMNLEVGLDGFVLPSGLRSGQRFTFELRRQTWPVVDISNFAELPIPFKAVAVDLETGERVLLERGNLAEAMRASMSLPGIFTPVEIGGRLLIDGGVVANLPIDVVREMGADIVIAVNIGDELVGRDQLGSMVAVTSQAMTISSAQGIAPLLEQADLVLTPSVAERGALDFTAIEEV
ncbi:MAG: patatin-like phospholipase family protein, partial [Myxococcales bacterium]|nr:patatin-like phospholipase family protein [Myxococcales bacterium]